MTLSDNSEFANFYSAFGLGYSFGQSFQIWFAGQYPYSGEMGCQTCGDCATDGGGEISWYYGMTILGDPTLYINPPAIDDVPPTTTLSFGTPHYTNGADDWVTSSTDITLSAVDNPGGIGVKEIHYKYEGTDFTIDQGDTTSFTIPNECTHQVMYFAKDDLGNKESLNTDWVKVDNTPPTTTSSYGSPYYSDGVNDYITPSTPITLTSSDGGICPCGVKEIWYEIQEQRG